MAIEQLNGYWRVTFAADRPLPGGFYEMTRADVVIRNGSMAGVDLGGCHFTGTLTLLDDGKVNIAALLDPRPAKDGILMMQPNGEITREPTARDVVLKVRNGGATLLLQGSSSLAGYTWSITAQRVAEFTYEDV